MQNTRTIRGVSTNCPYFSVVYDYSLCYTRARSAICFMFTMGGAAKGVRGGLKILETSYTIRPGIREDAPVSDSAGV
jgi:hypothetical protein